MSNTIELSAIGPIEHLSIPIPVDGGLVVLKARNGAGKSLALGAVETLLTGKGRPPVQDGQAKATVEGCNARITVGRQVRRTGQDELEVATLEGLDISQLVDPGIADEEKADAHRIKALVQLSGIPGSLDPFYDLVGGKDMFDALVPDPGPADDWLVVAGRIKRALEAQARQEEAQADLCRGKADGLKQSGQDLDMEAQSDADVLQAALEDAVAEDSRVKTRAQEIERARQRGEEARRMKQQAEADHKGETLIELIEKERAAVKRVEDCIAEIDRLTKALAEAEEAASRARVEAKHAGDRRLLVQQHTELMGKWDAQIKAVENLVPVPPEELVASAEKVQTARKAIELGALVRKAAHDRVMAKQQEFDAKRHWDDAEWARDRAKATEEVLSGIVAKSCTALRIEAGRLVLDTDRGVELFSDLSKGEKTRIAIDIAVEAVGANGLLILRQEFYEGLDEAVRAEVNAHAKERGVTILTAECSLDEAIVAEAV